MILEVIYKRQFMLIPSEALSNLIVSSISFETTMSKDLGLRNVSSWSQLLLAELESDFLLPDSWTTLSLISGPQAWDER